jgi:hypothetical protein
MFVGLAGVARVSVLLVVAEGSTADTALTAHHHCCCCPCCLHRLRRSR